MKLSINKIFVVLFALAAVSCGDLEERPRNLLAPENVFQQPSDLLVAVNGAYGFIGSERLFGRAFPMTLMLRGD
ncbi:MAG: RagB/SusD family nutrient uptake outer membrane protein, partial [Cyclobacteriaceae bacterium]